YVALSYCWGGQQTFATTISSYADRLEGFVKEDLPQTLQDGVHLAKELGARYIWIDSLCILQDSPEDKERELPKMSQYYSNAYVVISAAHAEKASDGFLEPRLVCKSHPDSGLPSDLSRMPVLTLGDEYGEMLFRQPMPYSLNDEPIERRAWALQERALSARVLIYGVYTVWQCNHHQRCDGGVDDFGYEVRDFNFRHHLGKGKTEPSPARGKPESRPGPVSMPEELYENWRKAVHAYSIRQLSFESDKLPAIAGLAQAFAETTGDHYLAGLWQTRLLRELLWSTRPEIPTARPEERRAPSWSWASVDYDITYKHLPPADATPVATVVSCTVTPASPDHIFGHNKEGRLELDAILLEIDGSTLKQILDAEYKQRGPDAALGFFSPDLWEGIVNRHRLSEGQRKREEFRPPERCFILPLFAVPPPEGQGEDKCQVIHGLALSVNADGTYERIVDFADVEMDEASLKAMSRDLTKRVVIV
ncbi:HET-domain-containing protein, partial [Sporormia fimetaria CBS 119925]